MRSVPSRLRSDWTTWAVMAAVLLLIVLVALALFTFG